MCDNQSVSNQLQRQLQQLATERKEMIDGNRGYISGYDPAVAAIEQQINLVQARINLILENEERPKNDGRSLRKVVMYDEEYEEYISYEVGNVASSGSGNHYVVNSNAALGPLLLQCAVGQVTKIGIVVSINGSPLLSVQEQQIAKRTDYEAQVAAEKRAEQYKHQQEIEQQKYQRLQEENEERYKKNKEEQEAQLRASVELRKLELQQELADAHAMPLISLAEARSRLEEIRKKFPPTQTKKVQALTVLHIRCKKSYDMASYKQKEWKNGFGIIVNDLFGIPTKDFDVERWFYILKDVESYLERMS